MFLTERNSENQNYFNFNDEPKVIENSFLSGESFDFIQISELIGLAFSQEDQKIIKVSKKEMDIPQKQLQNQEAVLIKLKMALD